MKVFSAVLLLFLVSCVGNSDDHNTNGASEDLDQFTTYEIDIHSKPVSFFDLVEEVEIVRLEETPESLLSRVNQLRFTNDFMIFPGGKGDVYIFNRDGSFVNKINNRGPGPDEYSFVSEYWIDEVINIYDAQGSRVQRYSLSGDYLGSQSLTYNGAFLYPMKEGGYVLDRNLRVQDSLNFNVVLLDDSFEKVVALNPFQLDENRSAIYSYSNSLSSYKDGLLYQKNMTDTVFLINGKSLKPLLTYDFGRDWVWNIEEIASDRLAMRDATMEGTHVWRTISQINPDYVFMNFKGGSEFFKYVIIDRSKGESKVVDLRKSAEQDYALTPIRWDNGRLVFSLRSTDVGDFLGQLEGNHYKFRDGTTLEEIESSENPVLVWVKFK